jgi:hypothetical protein
MVFKIWLVAIFVQWFLNAFEFVDRNNLSVFKADTWKFCGFWEMAIFMGCDFVWLERMCQVK